MVSSSGKILERIFYYYTQFNDEQLAATSRAANLLAISKHGIFGSLSTGYLCGVDLQKISLIQ